MPKYTLEKIDDNMQFEYTGDVEVTGNVGKNVTIKIKDGTLIINGNVGDGTNIALTQTPVVIAATNFFAMGSSSVVISGGSGAGRDLQIKGNVDKNVVIDSGSAAIAINGTIGSASQINASNASITTGDVGENAKLKTKNAAIQTGNVSANASVQTSNASITAGNVTAGARLHTSNAGIHAGNVAANATLHTSNAGIHAGHVAANATVHTSNANIAVLSADKTASLETTNGDIFEGGVKRKKAEANAGATVFYSNGGGLVISGGSVVFGGNGVVFFGANGQRINQSAAAAAPKGADSKEEPIMFKKG